MATYFFTKIRETYAALASESVTRENDLSENIGGARTTKDKWIDRPNAWMRVIGSLVILFTGIYLTLCTEEHAMGHVLIGFWVGYWLD